MANFADTPLVTPVEGRDPTGTVTVVRAGDTGVEVRVRELGTADRDPVWLGSALVQAWDDAALRHLEQQAAHAPDADALRATGEAFMRGERRLSTAPPEWIDDLAAGRPSALAAVDGVVPEHHRGGATVSSGRSRDGDVRTVLAPGGRPQTVTIDADWLVRASSATVARALTDALNPSGESA